MNISWRSWNWQLEIAISLAIGGAIAFSGNSVIAQITPDTTLGSENSTVTSTDAVDAIDGGATRGTNLFHSFQEFTVGDGRAAVFTNPSGIENILTRVTGANPSNILGTLGVAGGSANLFLINPKGIIFGPNARLDVGGSFVASTASSLNFADGTQFSATAPQTTPLLTVSVPLGLQYGVNPGRIQVQGDGQGIRLTTELIDTTSGLRVQPNQTLALVGGDVSLEGATLKSAGGRIELGSVGDNSLVSLTPINKGFSLDYDTVQNFRNIQLSRQTAVDASGAGSGDIQVWGRHVTLANGSQIEASTLGAEPGGTLVVNATDLVEVISTSSNGQFPSGLATNAAPGSTGSAGNLTINTRQLLVRDGAQIEASTLGAGKGGNLTVNATDSVQAIGRSANGRFGSGLFAQANPQADLNAVGDAGNLAINTRDLLVRDGAQVSTSTLGAGRGGNLTVNATDSVQVSEIGRSTRYGLVGSALSVQADSGLTGDAGDLTINTRQLLVRNGAQVSASTFGAGKGGNLTVNATDSVQVIGRSANGRFGSGLAAASNSGSTGDAGDLTINTHQLLVRDGAQISAGTFNFSTGKGGNLTVNATDSVQVIGESADGQSSSGLFTQADDLDTIGNAGNLIINTRQLLVRDGAQISASTFGAGKGGNLTVNATDSVQLVGRTSNGRAFSGLFASAQPNTTGDSGELTINRVSAEIRAKWDTL